MGLYNEHRGVAGQTLQMSECLAVIWGLGRTVTVQNPEEAMWKGQDRTGLQQSQRLREEG